VYILKLPPADRDYFTANEPYVHSAVTAMCTESGDPSDPFLYMHACVVNK